MKRVFSLLAIASIFAFFACTGNGGETTGADSTAVDTAAPVEQVEPAPAPVDTTAADTTAADTTQVAK